MADDDWFAEDPAEAAAAEAAAAEAAAVEEAAAAVVAAEKSAADAETAAAEAEAEGASLVRDPDAKLIFKHWVRPKFLQYNYMYDYRRNYYDEVITYLDRRQRGLVCEPPRAQTWGERALRTYIARPHADLLRGRLDAHLQHISTGARFHRYHTKSIISRKYSQFGFNTVSI